MKKTVTAAITIILLLTLLISCTRFTPLSPEQIHEKILAAEEAMAEGDDATAEAIFREVIKSDPNNGEANMGMGLIAFLKAHRTILDMVADYFTIAETVPTIQSRNTLTRNTLKKALPRALGKARNIVTTLRDFDFDQLQTNIAIVVDQLENAKGNLKTAVDNMTDEASMNLYPNAFDWNEDGFTDSASPLYLKFDPNGDGEKRLWWVLFYNEPGEFLSPDTQRSFFDDTIRGDAWFDIETFNYLLEDGIVPEEYEPTFDNTDKITMDATAAKMLLTIVNLELSILEPYIIWNFNPNPELTDYLEVASNTALNYNGPIDFATSTLDTDKNGTITNAEFRAVLPDTFFAFYDNPNGGADAITDWKEAIVDFCDLALEIAEMEIIDFIPFEINEELEMIKTLITDPATKVQLTEEVALIPYNFFNSPDNFADLKNFIPNVGYDPEMNIELPDPTFGGLVEGLEN